MLKRLGLHFFESTDSPGFIRDFNIRIDKRANNFLKILSVLAAILFPLFGILDHIMYPGDLAWKLNLFRLLVTPFILLVFLFTFWSRAHRYVLFSGSILYQVMALVLDLMVAQTGGAESRYYAGIFLVLLAMFVYMPWRPLASVLNGLLIYLIYLGTVLLADGPSVNIRYLISNSYFLLSTVFLGSIWAVIGFRVLIREARAGQFLAAEKERSDQLLLNVLPVTVARELKERDYVRPVLYNNISVLFTDFVGFTRLSATMSPEDLLNELDFCFQQFDSITEKYGLEKLKTIGDSYMCAGGIPVRKKTHALSCVLAALEMLDFTRERQEDKRRSGEDYWDIRIGIHSGPVVAGVTGMKKFAYDIWGDTVNTASRMEHYGEINRVNISRATHKLVRDFFVCQSRGRVRVKGKGELEMFRVEAIHPELADARSGGPGIEFFRRYRSYLVYGR